jgi:hypothetical protein
MIYNFSFVSIIRKVTIVNVVHVVTMVMLHKVLQTIVNHVLVHSQTQLISKF